MKRIVFFISHFSRGIQSRIKLLYQFDILKTTERNWKSIHLVFQEEPLYHLQINFLTHNRLFLIY